MTFSKCCCSWKNEFGRAGGGVTANCFLIYAIASDSTVMSNHGELAVGTMCSIIKIFTEHWLAVEVLRRFWDELQSDRHGQIHSCYAVLQ